MAFSNQTRLNFHGNSFDLTKAKPASPMLRPVITAQVTVEINLSICSQQDQELPEGKDRVFLFTFVSPAPGSGPDTELSRSISE